MPFITHASCSSANKAYELDKMDRYSLLLVTSPEGRSQNFTGGRAPLTALIGYLNVLIEVLLFLRFSLAGHN